MAAKCTGQDVNGTGSEEWKGCKEGRNLYFLSIYLIQTTCPVLYMCNHISFLQPHDVDLIHPMFTDEETEVEKLVTCPKSL